MMTPDGVPVGVNFPAQSLENPRSLELSVHASMRPGRDGMSFDPQGDATLPRRISLPRESPPRSEQRKESFEEDRFWRIAALAEECEDEHVKEEAGSAAERIAEGRFYVACVGQFKRGKSTLLNALIGDSLLPSGVTPVTTVPTVVRFGEHRRNRSRGGLHFRGGKRETESAAASASRPDRFAHAEI